MTPAVDRHLRRDSPRRSRLREQAASRRRAPARRSRWPHTDHVANDRRIGPRPMPPGSRARPKTGRSDPPGRRRTRSRHRRRRRTLRRARHVAKVSEATSVMLQRVSTRWRRLGALLETSHRRQPPQRGSSALLQGNLGGASSRLRDRQAARRHRRIVPRGVRPRKCRARGRNPIRSPPSPSPSRR